MHDYGLDFERLVACFPAFEAFYSQRVGSLSGGERRILEVFAVLASPDARFCLLDEPFSQVSPLHAGVLKTLITAAVGAGGVEGTGGFNRSSGLDGTGVAKAILISDHLYRDVCAVSDDVYILAVGTTYPVTSPDDLRKYGYTK
jgi:ABC-type lipopolysaccharide export system ATPase subunit